MSKDPTSFPIRGEYTLLGGSLLRKTLQRDFLDQVNDLTEFHCFDDLMETCFNLLPCQLGQLEFDLATGAADPLTKAIRSWQGKWRIHALDPRDDWIFETAIQTLSYRRIWEVVGVSPYVNGLPQDRKPIPRTWLPPIQGGGGYPHQGQFHAQTNLGLERRAQAKRRLQKQFEAWVERFLDEAENLAVQSGAEKEPTLRERDTSVVERLRWVALYQVCGKSHLWIREDSRTSVRPERVWGAIQDTARFVGLRLRSRNY